MLHLFSISKVLSKYHLHRQSSSANIKSFDSTILASMLSCCDCKNLEYCYKFVND